ncbi:MAG: acyl carrier protein [Cyanobium sp. CZS 25K]|nr:acyl carrier protein [Cyanobium sp. CZS25K]
MTDQQHSDRTGQDQVLAFIGARLRRAGAVFDDADLSALEIDTVGIDSLELTELIMELEDKFQVVIDDTILTGSTTVAQLAESVAHDAGGGHGG